ncbi:unnamed protein product, partial [Mesorhabditis belari]|uniref:Abnormal cell migration protein 18-like fibronectin type I domain-containing protein n=1 Tax=Mesorhabditis belari TaxID=2138241 RepID=A0AAF3EA17_9BILA
MFSVALLFVSVTFAEPIFSVSGVKPYEVKETWVQNFIKFQKITEKSGKKKIIPIGCVPTNSETGTVLAINETLQNTDFLYLCKQDEDGVVNWEAMGCFSRDGRLLKIGQARVLDNGTTIEKCDIGSSGAVAKSVETAAGCFGKSAVYFDGADWIQEIENRKKDDMLEGVWMKCFRPHNGYYESHVIGCASDTLLVATGDTAEISGGRFVRCVERSKDVVEFVTVDKSELSCQHENATIEHGSSWNDTSRAAILLCQNTQVIKTACLLNGEVLDLGQEVTITLGEPDNCVFLCHEQSNAYVCPKKIAEYKIVEDTEELATTLSPTQSTIDRARPPKATTQIPLSRLLSLRKYKKIVKKEKKNF